MARPKESIHVIQMKGKTHMGKAEIEQRKAEEVKAPSDNVAAPDYLPARLKTRFNEYAKQLVDLNIFGNIDAEALGRYLTAQDAYEVASKAMLKMDIVNDIDQYSKLVNVHNKLFTQARQTANDLGLSISSRGKLVLPKDNTPVKPKTETEMRFANRL